MYPPNGKKPDICHVQMPPGKITILRTGMKLPSLLLVDNQDSFTFNLVEAFRRIGVEDLLVLSEGDVTMQAAERADRIVFSPGPGLPEEHPACLDLLARFAGRKAILGVCLGHQMIGLFYGAKLEHLGQPNHGCCVQAARTAEDYLLAELPENFEVGLYHSWGLSGEGLPDELDVIARERENGAILAIRHRQHDIRGVQFHPESVLTPQGDSLLKAFWQERA